LGKITAAIHTIGNIGHIPFSFLFPGKRSGMAAVFGGPETDFGDGSHRFTGAGLYGNKIDSFHKYQE